MARDKNLQPQEEAIFTNDMATQWYNVVTRFRCVVMDYMRTVYRLLKRGGEEKKRNNSTSNASKVRSQWGVSKFKGCETFRLYTV